MKLHIPSALIGAGLLIAGLVTTAFVSPGTYQRVAVIFPVQVQGIPTHDQLVTIPPAQPFVVPTGKVLVMTCVAGQGWFDWTITVDGVAVLGGGMNSERSFDVLFWGVPVPEGSSVVITSDVEGAALLLGYLADA
jgi:hypothetical protein